MTKMARTRHLRHRGLDRTRYGDTLPNWLSERATSLAATGAATAITFTNATNTVNAVAHGIADLDGPLLLGTDTALPAELSATARYWLIPVDANSFQLAASRDLAAKGVAVEFSDDGTGNHTIARAAETSADVFDWNHQGAKPETINALDDIDNL